MEGFLISNDLPAELILEILLNLPVKSLLRLKCVCKSWFGLINTNKFMTMRCNKKESILAINRFNSSLSIISNYNDSYSADDLNVDFSHIEWSYIKDLELLACDGIIFGSNNVLGHYVLHNLATREIVFLPETSEDHSYKTWLANVGFGYDLKNHQYKVVRITEERDRKTYDEDIWFYNVEVYTLGTDSWRKVKNSGNFNSMDIGTISGLGFYFNGAIHWEGWYPGSFDYQNIINSFNLGDEEFQVILLSDDDWAWKNKQFLVWNGCLAVSVSHPNFSSLDIFVMKEYGVKESWTKLFMIEPGCFSYVWPLTIWKNNEFLFEVIDENDARNNFHLVSYNPEKQELKDLQIPGCEWYKAFVHMENLVSIKWRRGSIP